jgi:hypothetical protein
MGYIRQTSPLFCHEGVAIYLVKFKKLQMNHDHRITGLPFGLKWEISSQSYSPQDPGQSSSLGCGQVLKGSVCGCNNTLETHLFQLQSSISELKTLLGQFSRMLGTLECQQEGSVPMNSMHQDSKTGGNQMHPWILRGSIFALLIIFLLWRISPRLDIYGIFNIKTLWLIEFEHLKAMTTAIKDDGLDLIWRITDLVSKKAVTSSQAVKVVF